jgi:hypothetical protein
LVGNIFFILYVENNIKKFFFLALKLLVFSFPKNIELTKISTVIRQLCFKSKSIYLWKFLEFITANRTSLFLLLKPFIEEYVINYFHLKVCKFLKNLYIFLKKITTQSGENEYEHAIRDSIQEKIKCNVTSFPKCNDKVLEELVDEMNSIKLEFSGKTMQ